MIINKNNEEKVNDIYIHDSILTDFNYNFYMEKLSINLLSTWEEHDDVELIFKGVIMVYFQNADFWSVAYGKSALDIYSDENLTYYKKLVEEYKEKAKDYVYTPSEAKNNTTLPDKFNDNVMEVGILMDTGGEIRILCKEIIVNEIA